MLPAVVIACAHSHLSPLAGLTRLSSPDKGELPYPVSLLLLVRYGQGIVVGVDDEDGQQARGFAVTRVFTHFVMRARHLLPAFTDPVDPRGLVIDLAANSTGQNMGVDEGRAGMAMGRRLTAWRVVHDEGGQALSGDVWNGVLEDLLYLLWLLSMRGGGRKNDCHEQCGYGIC